MFRQVLLVVMSLLCFNAIDANTAESRSLELIVSNEDMPISINCDILYLKSEPTFAPSDAEAWDNGFIPYIDGVNGTNSVTVAYTKPDASGLGLYDPNNTSIPISINVNDYDLIIISPTTDFRLSTDLTDALKVSPRSILNFNFTAIDDLGTGSSGSKTQTTSLYIDDTNTQELFVNESNFYFDRILVRNPSFLLGYFLNRYSATIVLRMASPRYSNRSLL